mgnify:CR=1 FL=1
MFPIRDHNPSERTPIVTWMLLAANIIVFLSYYPGLSADDRALSEFFMTWGMIPSEVLSGAGWDKMFTHMFLHGSWMHLIGNMLFLWIF